MMKSVISNPQVLYLLSGMLIGLLSGCASLSSSGDSLQAEDLTLQPVETLERPPSQSAEAMAYFSLGLNRELEKDYPGAIEAFQQAIHKDPENDVLYMIASQRLIQAHRLEDAFALLNQLLEMQPENVTARRWLAKLYIGQGEKEKAREQLHLALSYHPKLERIYIEAIQLALAEKDMNDVLDIARSANLHAEKPEKSTEILIKLLIEEQKQAPDAKTLLDLQTEKTRILEQAILDFPESEVFYLIQAENAVAQNQWDKAFLSFSNLDQQFQGTEEIRTRIMVNAIQISGGNARGLRLLEKRILEQPETSLTLYLSGLIKELVRQPEQARLAYQRAVELDPEDYEAQKKLALLTYQTGQTRQASKLLESVITHNPDDPQLLLLAGQIALGAEDYTLALTYLQKCLYRVRQGEEIENLPMVYAQLAMTLLATESDPQKAVDAMLESAASPGNLEWIWQYAIREILQEKEKSPGKAEAMQTELLHILEDLSDRLPKNPEVEWLIGRNYALQKKYPEAVQAYERYEKLAQKDPRSDVWLNEDYLFDVAAAYEREGKIETSVDMFRQIISKNPNHHPSLNYLAYMWAERKENLDQALSYTQRAIKLDPDNGSYIDTLGWIYYQQENFKAAYRELKKAAELIPDESVVVEHLGDVLMKLSRPWEAMGYYKIALLLDAAERAETVQNSLRKAEKAVSAQLAP
ncbi:tetratricopeptide repeat protein [Kiritimatiellaeota bacterium B1221]|nr:tetratricopeptide repeat protein [Kiritimatiellaeota bacterium B1221]